MNPAIKTKRAPEIGEYLRGTGTLVEIQDVAPPPPPPPPLKDYIFSDTTACVRVRMNGEILKEFNEVWDHYGDGESVKDCIRVAKAYAAKHSLGEESQLHVVAVKKVNHSRKRPHSDPERMNYSDPDFFEFERISRGAAWGVPEETEEIVWSSRDPLPKERKEKA